MGRHKRIPSKNRKKLKSVDPFNKDASALKAQVMRKINWEPNDDEQPMSRSLMELERNKAEAVIDKKEAKRRKQRRNKVLAEAEKIGIKKGRFETIQHFVRRVERMTYAAVKEHETLVKQGLGGRDEAEIEADFKILEDKEKRAKEQKRNEIQNKIKAAREKRERMANLKEEKLKERTERKRRKTDTAGIEDDAVTQLEMENHETSPIVGCSSNTKAIGAEEVRRKKSRKAGRSDKIRELKKLAAENERAEAVLNRREVIAFGERYDAPPNFKGEMKRKMDPIMAKAGCKNLLLRSLFSQKSDTRTNFLNEKKQEKPGELDRQQVIEAYRELKRKRCDTTR